MKKIERNNFLCSFFDFTPNFEDEKFIRALLFVGKCCYTLDILYVNANDNENDDTQPRGIISLNLAVHWPAFFSLTQNPSEMHTAYVGM